MNNSISFSRKENDEREFAIDVVRKLREAGYQALWAGGCVRDLLLGRVPTDYDVATSARPAEVQELFGRNRTLPVGVAFGVVIVRGKRRQGEIEVASFRTDASYSDGRRPDSIQFSTPEEDAQRRDFTINGMFYDPIDENVIDFVGGQEDLKRKVIRAIGVPDQRIAEDKLRMLRAVRFAARFGFEFDEATRASVARHAADVVVVSGERIQMEMRSTLLTRQPGWAIATWRELGLLQFILPELGDLALADGAGACRLVDEIPDSNWITRLAALVWSAIEDGHAGQDCAALVSSIKQRLKLSNADATALSFAVSQQEFLDRANDIPWSMLQPLLVSPHVTAALDLLRARCELTPSGAPLTWLEERLRQPPEILNPPAWLEGADLIALGLRPSPQFRVLLENARRMQLDGELETKEAALEWARLQSEVK